MRANHGPRDRQVLFPPSSCSAQALRQRFANRGGVNTIRACLDVLRTSDSLVQFAQPNAVRYASQGRMGFSRWTMHIDNSQEPGVEGRVQGRNVPVRNGANRRIPGGTSRSDPLGRRRVGRSDAGEACGSGRSVVSDGRRDFGVQAKGEKE